MSKWPVEQFLTVFVHLCNLVIQASSVHFSLAFRSFKLPREWPIKPCLQNSGTSLAHSSQFFLLPSPEQFLKPPNYSQFVLSQQWLHNWCQFSVFVAFMLLWPVWEYWERREGWFWFEVQAGKTPSQQSWKGVKCLAVLHFQSGIRERINLTVCPQRLTWSTFQNSTNSCSDTLLWKCLLRTSKGIFGGAQSKVNNTSSRSFKTISLLSYCGLSLFMF